MYDYNSFARGYHAFMNIWNLLVRETSKCRQELSKEVDKNAVTIIRSDLCEKEAIPGHSPQKIPKICSVFLKVPNT